MWKEEQIISDIPVSQKEEDAFQRYPFAKRIASTIVKNSTSSSMVIGIYGKWGEGKSSVLNFIKSELKDEEVTVVNFNPWLFPNENQLILSFFQVLSSHLQMPLKGKGEKLGELMRDYASAIGLLGSLVGMPNPKDTLDAIGKKLSSKPVDYYKDTLNKALEDSGKKVVIFIDDIDRLSIGDVQAVFKLVKLAADFKNTVYVLSFDDELVSASLDPIYSKGGQDYLEKIVQLPLKLPKAQPVAIKNYTIKSLDAVLQHHDIKIEGDELHRFLKFFDDRLLKLIDNPRFAVRFSNTLNFSIPLLKGEANLVDLIVIESVKVVYPNLYSFIRDNSSLFFGNFSATYGDYHKSQAVKEQTKSRIAKHLELYDENIRAEVKDLLIEIFPQLDAVFGNRSYSDHYWQKWYKSKRICSGKYFNRYFTYVVLEGEISDVEFELALERLSREDFLNNKNALREVVSQFDPESLVTKLQFLEESFNEETKLGLALNLSLLGDFYPNQKQLFSAFGPYRQMSTFIRRCVGAQGENKLSVATEVIERAQPIDFAFEIWFAHWPNPENPGKSVLTQNEFKQFSRSLFERCTSEFNLESLFNVLEDDNLGHLLDIGAELYGNKFKAEITEIIKKESRFFIVLLYAYSSTIYSSARPEPYKFDFTQSYYDKLIKVVDIDTFYQRSQELYGDQSAFEPSNDREPLTDEQLVGAFQRVHLSNNPVIKSTRDKRKP